jgi:hypothetical protein
MGYGGDQKEGKTEGRETEVLTVSLTNYPTNWQTDWLTDWPSIMMNIKVQLFPEIPKFIHCLASFLLEQILSQFKTSPASYIGLNHVFDNCLSS